MRIALKAVALGRDPALEKLLYVVAMRADDLLLGRDRVGLHIGLEAPDVSVLRTAADDHDLGDRRVLLLHRRRVGPLDDPGA